MCHTFKKMEEQVILVTSDGVSVPVSAKVASFMGIVVTAMEGAKEDAARTGKQVDNVCPVPMVSSKVLGAVLEWITYHLDHDIPEMNPSQESTATLKERSNEWNANWITSKWNDDEVRAARRVGKNWFVQDIWQAATYLDVKGLGDLVRCFYMAHVIKGRKKEEVIEWLGPFQEGKVQDA